MASYQDSATSTATGANGVTYSYRRMGISNSAQPLVLLQHFRGNLDNWDPALIDALPAEREVIAFDKSGWAQQRARFLRLSPRWPTAQSHSSVRST